MNYSRNNHGVATDHIIAPGLARAYPGRPAQGRPPTANNWLVLGQSTINRTYDESKVLLALDSGVLGEGAHRVQVVALPPLLVLLNTSATLNSKGSAWTIPANWACHAEVAPRVDHVVVVLAFEA